MPRHGNYSLEVFFKKGYLVLNKYLKNNRVYTWISYFHRKFLYFSSSLLNIPHLHYYCPVCERKVHKWLPFQRYVGPGNSQLEPDGRLCPHCNSFERTRHFSLFLTKSKILDNNPKFLHFAPEDGLENKIRTALGQLYTTVDLNMRNVDRKEDITMMSVESNSFDYIYCSNVLEHIEDDVTAMSELYRILAPGGVAIIQVPIEERSETYEDFSITDPAQRAKHFGQGDHVRIYGADIKERLSSVGFKVNPFYMLDLLDLDEYEIHRMNIGKRELIHECIK